MRDLRTEREDWKEKEMRAYRRKQRLKRERRNKLLLLFAMLLVIGGLALPSCAIKSNANDGYKYYTDIIVQPGESLWKIADRYTDYNHYKDINTYISEVRHINHIEDDSALIAGQMLIIPYYSDEYIY
ncbi:MAG: LysM peptidoglycan-binding domain-containing protein [Acetatifactor sp.]